MPVRATGGLLFVAALAVSLLAACSDPYAQHQSAAASGPAMEMKAAPTDAGGGATGAMLAYEHHIAVRLPVEEIAPRHAAVQAACRERRFGECVLLNISQQGGDHPSASVTVRIVPSGVEPMIAMAGEGAEFGSRSTHAEDLAVVVRDNALEQDRLRTELQRLQEFQQRRDLAVADMIALAERMAATRARLDAAEREGAQHRRRIDTQLLTLAFSPTGGQAGRNEIVQAVRDFGATLSMGTAWTIRALAFLIPLGVLLAIAVALVRRWRRRARLRRSA
ncbi:DUF4349 domain-containing protein [Marilutibacter chinensis]|uniref:DUF4349 domain-containing protein n=1 Tax=Marilutibacter chinensis TaxID=2912247 RepID=A0ABS9HSR0_9GAMM|nr:DUF4349 domain-containing protein [Lysobacter chinensis]MCF7221195.1 DUF4349 domain-containing protein [Lysobacter chinensis]MCF7223064.1 DUF4349 domain-containing protein [Lysobacter chinensis]